MPKRRIHERVDATIFDEPRNLWQASHRFSLPRNIVWAALKDADTWPRWLPLKKVVWTSPAPFGIGTTRTVTLPAGEAEEEFFAWEEGCTMAFRFSASTIPFDAFAEDYRLRDVPGGCELTITHAAKTNTFILMMIKPVATLALKQSMKKLEKYLLANRQQFEQSAMS